MNTIDELHNALKDYEQTPDGQAQDLKNSFSTLFIKLLEDKGLTQKQLSEESGVTQRLISGIVHGDHNSTLETLGQLLWALNTRVKIEPISAVINQDFLYSNTKFTASFTVNDSDLSSEQPW